MMTTIRCSSLPRIALCPASARAPAVKIELPNEAADMGTAFHSLMSERIRTGETPCFVSDGVDADELRRLYYLGESMWKRLEPHFDNPVAEHSFEPLLWGSLGDPSPSIKLTGTGDLLSLSPDGAAVRLLDWKSGWGDEDHEDQVRGYGLLALREVPTADRVVASVMKLRRGILETYEWSRGELESWWEGLAGRILAESAVYHPSPAACGYCPLFAECPARAAMLKTSMEMVVASAEFEANNPGDIVAATPPFSLARLVEQARMVAKCAEMAIGLVRAAVINAGGVIPIGDGRELQINAQVRTEIDFAAGEGVLRAHCGDELGKALAVRKSKSKTDPDKLGVEDIVKAAAPRGAKGKAVEALMAELDQAAALRLTTVQHLVLTKAARQLSGGLTNGDGNNAPGKRRAHGDDAQ